MSAHSLTPSVSQVLSPLAQRPIPLSSSLTPSGFIDGLVQLSSYTRFISRNRRLPCRDLQRDIAHSKSCGDSPEHCSIDKRELASGKFKGIGGKPVSARTGFSWGAKTQFLCIAMHPARDGVCCETLNAGLSCSRGAGPIPRRTPGVSHSRSIPRLIRVAWGSRSNSSYQRIPRFAP